MQYKHKYSLSISLQKSVNTIKTILRYSNVQSLKYFPPLGGNLNYP